MAISNFRAMIDLVKMQRRVQVGAVALKWREREGGEGESNVCQWAHAAEQARGLTSTQLPNSDSRPLNIKKGLTSHPAAAQVS